MPVKYTREVLSQVVATSTSILQVLRKLGVRPAGGSHSYIASLIKRYGLDTAHFTGRGSNRGVHHVGGPDRIPWHEVLVLDRLGGRKEITSRLRRAMIEAGIPYLCKLCGNPPEWCGRLLTLQIDHMNGDFLDNRRENLRFTCPNCHSQTENWGSKNRPARVV